MKDKKRSVKHIKITFLLVCVLLAGYMTLKESLRYLENSDTSSITFKEFAKSLHDTYPTFSICITDDQSEERGYDFGLMYSIYRKDIEETLPRLDLNDTSGNKRFMIFPKILAGKQIPLIKSTSQQNLTTKLDIRNVSLDYFNSFTIDLKLLLHLHDLEAFSRVHM